MERSVDSICFTVFWKEVLMIRGTVKAEGNVSVVWLCDDRRCSCNLTRTKQAQWTPLNSPTCSASWVSASSLVLFNNSHTYLKCICCVASHVEQPLEGL